MLNFSNFRAVTTANNRDNSHLAGNGQAFNFKYRKFKTKDKNGKESVQTIFSISDKLFALYNLSDKDTGLIELIDTDPETKVETSYLAIVDNDHAVFLKTNKKNENGKKGQAFKSSILETSLSGQGLVDTNAINVTQKLDLVLEDGTVGQTIAGLVCKGGLLRITKAEDATLTDAEKAVDAAPVADEAPVAPEGSTVQPEEALTESATEATAPVVDVVDTSVASAPATPDDDF